MLLTEDTNGIRAALIGQGIPEAGEVYPYAFAIVAERVGMRRSTGMLVVPAVYSATTEELSRARLQAGAEGFPAPSPSPAPGPSPAPPQSAKAWFAEVRRYLEAVSDRVRRFVGSL